MKKTLALMLAALLIFSCALAEEQPLPELLRFRQETREREYVHGDVYIQRSYVVTQNKQVNAELRGVVDLLVEEGRPHLPRGPVHRDKSYLRVGTGVSRTGQSWMSFLTLGSVKHEYEQTHVTFDARAYDMATGRRLTMDDLFAPDSQGWEIMAQAVKAQLNAYFPHKECDSATLEALCTREALGRVPFTLTGGSLRLHYWADALYPGQNTLMHVRLMYPDIRPHMREEAQKQTDNSCYKLIALTFDDGPAHRYSINVAETLRAHGADGTFFLVGTMLNSGHYVMAFEHDAGFPLAYHSYFHRLTGNLAKGAPEEWEKFSREIAQITGTVPTIMRAPGGDEGPFITANIGLPLINWNISAGDGADVRSYDDADIHAIACNVGGGAQDGDVVLMHDLRRACHQYLEPILTRLEERGFLCVTVEELFANRGIPLLPNTIYYEARPSLQ
ncbi:MAG: polysaccharide deacetylase family protein [Clostridia bacterium]|nr:polysaccharide deacetylase family protein [Clostridia bacterium]